MILAFSPGSARAQLLDPEDLGETTAKVSPSLVQSNADEGNIQSREVMITNNTPDSQKYHVRYQDFELTPDGRTTFLEAGSCEQSLSDYIRIEPDEIELDPGETAGIQLTVSVPEGKEFNNAAWGVVMIEQAGEQPDTGTDPIMETGEKGLVSTLAYSVWVYQNPPKAENRHVDITNFIVGNKSKNKGFYLKVKNKGDGISVCKAYVEITNLATGEQILVEGKHYTILPGTRQTLLFELDEDLPKGNYNAVGVLDYSNQEMVATELEFKID